MRIKKSAEQPSTRFEIYYNIAIFSNVYSKSDIKQERVSYCTLSIDKYNTTRKVNRFDLFYEQLATCSFLSMCAIRDFSYNFTFHSLVRSQTSISSFCLQYQQYHTWKSAIVAQYQTKGDIETEKKQVPSACKMQILKIAILRWSQAFGVARVSLPPTFFYVCSLTSLSVLSPSLPSLFTYCFLHTLVIGRLIPLES